MAIHQDNVFVNVVASIQYRALADKANDAFYKLSNTRTQIQAYVFDGTNQIFTSDHLDMSTQIQAYTFFFVFNCSVIRASVPKLNLDDAFEQKNEIAKAVEEELEKVM